MTFRFVLTYLFLMFVQNASPVQTEQLAITQALAEVQIYEQTEEGFIESVLESDMEISAEPDPVEDMTALVAEEITELSGLGVSRKTQ